MAKTFGDIAGELPDEFFNVPDYFSRSLSRCSGLFEQAPVLRYPDFPGKKSFIIEIASSEKKSTCFPVISPEYFPVSFSYRETIPQLRSGRVAFSRGGMSGQFPMDRNVFQS